MSGSSALAYLTLSSKMGVLTLDIFISPFPYHPYGSAKTYGTVADEEGARLEALFKEIIAKKTGA